MEALIAVKDSEGKIYTMPSEGGRCILSVHYSTSYYTFDLQDEVEEEGRVVYPKKTIYVEAEDAYWVDLLAIQGEERGELL